MAVIDENLRKILQTQNDEDPDGSEGCRIRVFLISSGYEHIHKIVTICNWVSSRPDYELINLDVRYFNNGVTVKDYYRSDDRTYNKLLEDTICYIHNAKDIHKEDQDIAWLCTVAENMIKMEASNEDGTMAMLLSDFNLRTNDENVAVIMENLQTVINKHAHNDDVVLICKWIHEMLQEIRFDGVATTAYWNNSPHFKKNDRYKPASMKKIQLAFLFLDYVRDQFRASGDGDAFEIIDTPEIEWICDLAKKIIAFMPDIGRELDYFTEDKELPPWGHAANDFGWLCLHNSLLPFRDHDLPGISLSKLQ